MGYDNTGKASSWPSRGDNQPRRVKCFAHRDIQAGEEFEVALWPNRSDNPKAPDFTGKVQDAYVPNQPPQDDRIPGGPVSPPAGSTDDIPFN